MVDVLAALIVLLAPRGRMGVMGFAGGGIMAPLRKLGVPSVIDAVDLDRDSYGLFRMHCPALAADVDWQQGDALAWLRHQAREFDLLLDDLSVPQDGDVFKPAISRRELPGLMLEHLRPGGFGVFNLLRDPAGAWSADLMRIVRYFRAARIISFDDFEKPHFDHG